MIYAIRPLLTATRYQLPALDFLDLINRASGTRSKRAIAVTSALLLAHLLTTIAGGAEPTTDSTDRKATVPASAAECDAVSPVAHFAMLAKADAALREFDYGTAIHLYEQITQENPHNGDHWLRLARCQERAGQLEQAIASLERGVLLGDDSSPGQTQYHLAVLNAKQGNVDAAIEWLQQALAARHEHRSALRTDKRLDVLRGDPRFTKLAAGAAGNDNLSRAERWNSDLDHLLDEASRMHVLWREQDRDHKLQRAIDGIRQRIDALSDQQMLIEIQKALVFLGDGHSLVRAAGNIPGAPRLPLRLYYFSDGLFIIDADEPYHDLIGCRIDKIGNATSAEAEQLLATIVSHDNPMGVKGNGVASLVNPLRLQSLGIIENPDLVHLQLTDPGGHQRTADVEPRAPVARDNSLCASQLPGAGPVPVYLRRANENLWFERLPDEDILYVQFNDVLDQPGRQIKNIAQQLRYELGARPPTTLVLDVRHNGGGNTYLCPPLLKAILYYELTQPAGRLFVVIGRATFSAAQNFTNDIDRLTDAVFVGEPTGSRPSFVGESTQVVLPFSNVSVSISTRLHQHAYATDRRIWIAPDVPAPLASTDYFANRDPALDAILAIVHAEALPGKP